MRSSAVFAAFGLSALATLLLAPMPTASAAWTLDVQAPTEPLAPGAGHAVLLEVSDDCQDLLARAGPNADGVPFTFVVEASSPYIIQVGPKEGAVPLAPCLSGETTSATTVEWTTALAPDAPGLEALQSNIRAVLAGSAAAPERSAPGSITVVSKAVFLVQGNVANGKLITVHGDRGVAHLEFTNFGNCKIALTFEAMDAPNVGSFTFPEPIAMNTEQSGLDNSVNATIEFEPGSGSWKRTSLTFTVTPSAFVDPQVQGEAVTMTVWFRNAGFFERTVPAPPLPLALLVVSLAAVLARRRA